MKWSSFNPIRATVEYVVDNRVFLLGLDSLYRRSVKRHESTELLECARAIAARLNVLPADVPIEGYYTETRQLTEYFRLIRGLQEAPEAEAGRVAPMREFQRLLSVTSSPLYGRSVRRERLLPVGRDPLSQALLDIGGDLGRLTVGNVVEHAHQVAVETEDFSLVGLACIARDPVMLAALRESAVLYAERMDLMSARRGNPPIPVYLWEVDEELARRGGRFVATFNELFDEDLPEPGAENAHWFFNAADEDEIIGRCVCIGQTPMPVRYYHWAVRRGPGRIAALHEFWDSEVWTTDHYRNHPPART